MNFEVTFDGFGFFSFVSVHSSLVCDFLDPFWEHLGIQIQFCAFVDGFAVCFLMIRGAFRHRFLMIFRDLESTKIEVLGDLVTSGMSLDPARKPRDVPGSIFQDF